MWYRLGRLLQIVGLILLPVGIMGNLVPNAPLKLWGSLAVAGAGISIFYLGRWVQGLGRR